MSYGAYNDTREGNIIWFRTERPLATGFYHRHTRRGDPPDVYIAQAIPELIMKVHPWIHAEEAAFQREISSPALKDEDKDRIAEQLTDQLVQRLDPDDDAIWVDDPHWVKHLESD